VQTFVIRQRVADFLRKHTPFEVFSEEDLLSLAGSGRVLFHESEEYIFHQGGAKGRFLWMIQQGKVELLDEAAKGQPVRDLLGEGDLLGMERFAGDGSFLHSARTATDVILYAISAEVFEASMEKYPSVKRYVAAHDSVSGVRGFSRTSWLEAKPPAMQYLEARLLRLPEDVSREEALSAIRQSKSGIGCLVNEQGASKGILTAMDLYASADEFAASAARICAASLPPTFSTRTAIREMLLTQSNEVLITDDGSPTGVVQAVLTPQDLAMFSSYNPVELIRAIRVSSSAAEIRPLIQRAQWMIVDGLAQPSDLDDCSLLGVEVVKAIADASIGMAKVSVENAGIPPPSVPCCFALFGAVPRGDMVAPTTPAIAVVYDDAEESITLEDHMYFVALAGEIGLHLHECGIAGTVLHWPEGVQPSMPLSEWARLYRETVRNPLGHDLYGRREFFDFAPLSGDAAILAKIQAHMLFEYHDVDTAVPLLANDTFMHLPPLTFFRGMVLGMDGVQHESFNIADAIITPSADAARVFAISKGRFVPAETLARLSSAIDDFPEGASILTEGAAAYRIGMYYRTLAEGDNILPAKLSKFDQLLLKTALTSIQNLLEFTHSTFIVNQ
jgi:CBS domain-containing protein